MKLAVKNIAICLFMMLASVIHGAEVIPAGPGKRVPAGRGQGHWRTYGVPEGLADNRVRSIIQDRERFLWLGTITGIGMPQEALDTIFDEFQQVEGSEQTQKGTGLGLAISKQYTELLGGSIGVESEVGKGTMFTVQVPILFNPTQQSAKQSS